MPKNKEQKRQEARQRKFESFYTYTLPTWLSYMPTGLDTYSKNESLSDWHAFQSLTVSMRRMAVECGVELPEPDMRTFEFIGYVCQPRVLSALRDHCLLVADHHGFTIMPHLPTPRGVVVNDPHWGEYRGQLSEMHTVAMEFDRQELINLS
jgi:hypothetical protein